MDKKIYINLCFVVPKKNVGKVMQIFKLHSNWMKKFYSKKNKGKKYLLSAFITKAFEFKDPKNPSKGRTNNILFTLNEEFTSLKSLKRHNDYVKKNNYFKDFSKIKNKYAKFRSANGKILHSII